MSILESGVDPVKLSNLVVGECYFIINFIEEEIRFPVVKTVIFIDHIANTEGDELYFQDIQSWKLLGPYSEDTPLDERDQIQLFVCDANQLNGIYDLKTAAEIFTDCSKRQIEMRIS